MSYRLQETSLRSVKLSPARGRSDLYGSKLEQVREVAKANGGRVRSSDLVKAYGWEPEYAAGVLRGAANRGTMIRYEPGELCFKPGKWEPSYEFSKQVAS